MAGEKKVTGIISRDAAKVTVALIGLVKTICPKQGTVRGELCSGEISVGAIAPGSTTSDKYVSHLVGGHGRDIAACVSGSSNEIGPEREAGARVLDRRIDCWQGQGDVAGDQNVAMAIGGNGGGLFAG